MTGARSKTNQINRFVDEDCQREKWEDHYCLEEHNNFEEHPKVRRNFSKFIFRDKHVKPKGKRLSTYKKDNSKMCIVFTCCVVFIIVTLVLVYVFKHQKIKDKKQLFSHQTVTDDSDIRNCDHIEVEDVWITPLPKLLTESAFRLLDVNQDGVLDIIFGFATGVDGYSIPRVVCDIYFNSTYPCFGGMMALDGRNGKELWRHYSDHELFGINCNADLDLDGINDCLGGGRAGAFDAVNGRTGELLWKFKDTEAKNRLMNLYTAHIIDDVDGDTVVDILVIHGGDPLSEPGSKHRLSGRIIFFSGKSGKVLSWSGVPDEKESYYSPQIITKPDGTKLVLIGTGGETHGGGLWLININDLFYRRLDKAVCIFSDIKKGVMTPPVLLDLNEDGEDDIVMSMFNSYVIAFDGKSLHQLWNFSVPSSESYNTPAPGFYNNDNIPDFLIKYAHGPGFPIYYYSETNILDGRNGKSLLKDPLLDTMGAQSSPMTISMEGYGNDVYLYWISDCEHHEGQGEAYKFVKGTNVHEQSRSDICRLRFKSKGFTKLMAKNQHMDSRGIPIYYSGDRKHVEHDHWINTTTESIHYIETHPDVYYSFLKYQKMEKNRNSINEKKNNRGRDERSKTYYHKLADKTYRKQRKSKRHIGPHDDDGIQRLLSTGTLAPTLLVSTHPKYNHSIDVVFATYWFFPAKTQAILPGDEKCIRQKMEDEKYRFDPKSKYYGLDHDGYEHAITEECLHKSGHELPEDETYESQSTYNPYNVHMGQMTVYRLRLTITCKECDQNEECSRVLPFEKQQWTSYMGNGGDSHWKTTAGN